MQKFVMCMVAALAAAFSSSASACALAGRSVWHDQFAVTLTLNGLSGSATAPYCKAQYAATISARSPSGGTILLIYPAYQQDCGHSMTEVMKFAPSCTTMSGTWTNAYGETGTDSWTEATPAGKPKAAPSTIGAGLR